VPTGFSEGGTTVDWSKGYPQVTFTPPSLTTENISLLGLISEVNISLPNLLVNPKNGQPYIPDFSKDLGLNMLAYDPIFDSGQFQILAMADMNPSVPDTPDVWEAILRDEIMGQDPTPEVISSAESTALSAPTLIGTGAANNWDSKDRWETGAQNDNDNPTTVYNGADFLTLDTMINSLGLNPSLEAVQPGAYIVPDPQNPSLNDLEVYGSNSADTITLTHESGNGVQVVLNGTTLGTYNPTGNIDVQAFGGDDQIAIQGDLGLPTTVSGGDGDDTITLSDGAGPGLTIDGGTGTNTLIGDNVATTWTINGPGSGSLSTGATFSNIQNLTGGTAADTFVFSGAGALSGNIEGGGGGDTLDFSLAPSQAVALTGPGAIEGYDGTSQGSETLGGTFSDIDTILGSLSQPASSLTGLDSDATWTIIAPTSQSPTAATSQYTRSSDGLTLNLGQFGVLNGGAGVDTFDIRSTGSALQVNGSAGNDAFIVSSTAGVDNFGDLSGIGGELTIDAGSGDANSLIIRNFNGVENPDVTVTASMITGFAPSPIVYAATGGSFGGATGGIDLIGSNTGADTFNIQSTLAGSQTRIESLGGDNTFNMGSAAPAFFGNVLDGIQGALTIVGSDAGSDALYVSDIASTASKTGVLTNSTINGLGMGPQGITYSGVSSVSVTLGGGSNNQFNIQSTAAGVDTFVGGFFGNETFYVGSNANNLPTNGSVLDSIQGPLTVSGDPADTMNIDDTGSSVSKTGTLTATTFTGMGMGPQGITYSGLKFLNIFVGTGGDTLNIQSTAAGTTTTFDQGLRITIGYSGNLGGLYVFVLYSIAGLE